jgi:hypothetical protein
VVVDIDNIINYTLLNHVDDNTYYLYKGELIEVDGHQYFAHSTNINYWIEQYVIAGMEYVLVDCGSNGGVCVDDMLVVE